MTEGAPPVSSRRPVQVSGEVFAVKRAGDYFHVTLVADGVAERARPGSFVALTVGGDTSGVLLRRAFFIYRARAAGVYGGTVELVVSVRGVGTDWLVTRPQHTQVDVVGPLGRPFALPKESISCALVGSGYRSAPLFGLAERLRERGCGVHMVIGADTESRLFGALEARRSAQSVTVTTEDGSVGIRGTVTEPLPQLLARNQIDVVYAAGPVAMLKSVVDIACTAGAWSQTALEPAMACCVGVCMACVVPVVAEGNVVKLSRACVEGPVFAGEKVRWHELTGSPVDAARSLQSKEAP
ncbi:MAG: dihydroorotate dehydrogenase electron transfer subunit [Nocardioidaceae bacterium]